MSQRSALTHEASLESLLRHRVAEGRKLFVPYVTAGLPSPQRFVELIAEIASSADAIEVGIPFSDPIMDGPVIQEASSRALQSGVTPPGALAMIREALRHAWIPVVVMTYFNPIHRIGEEFTRLLESSGTQGLVVPDLPFEETGELSARLTGMGIALVQMIAPTTPAKRAGTLAGASRGFVYAVSQLGVTGEREQLAETARQLVERIRPHTRLPVLLGIGISSAEQAREAAGVSDGVIVGSAIMKKVLGGDVPGAVTLCREIRRALGEGEMAGWGDDPTLDELRKLIEAGWEVAKIEEDIPGPEGGPADRVVVTKDGETREFISDHLAFHRYVAGLKGETY